MKNEKKLAQNMHFEPQIPSVSELVQLHEEHKMEYVKEK